MNNLKFKVILKNEGQIRECFGINFLTKKALVLIAGQEEWHKYKEIMQSTNFLDKNGVEIFEGYILNITDTHGDEYIQKVEYKDGGYFFEVGWDYKPSFDEELEFEVIGNIFENPNLIK